MAHAEEGARTKPGGRSQRRIKKGRVGESACWCFTLPKTCDDGTETRPFFIIYSFYYQYRYNRNSLPHLFENCIYTIFENCIYIQSKSIISYYRYTHTIFCWEALREELKHSPSLATLEVRADRKYKPARALITRSAHRAGALSTRTGAPWPCAQDCVRAGGARAVGRKLAKRLCGMAGLGLDNFCYWAPR